MALPLTIVVVVSMIKDAYEDYKRHKSDDSENDTITLKLDKASGLFVERKWKDIIVGDIIKVV
jgi:phospholipid-transporting ATPase